jgi:hypothetical protein
MGVKSPAEEIATVDLRIAAIEMEIARLQAQVMTLKKTRNGLTPLCRLPVEILGWIFLQTQVVKPNVHKGKSRNASLYYFGYDGEWEKAISICSYVYRVCSNLPELWAHIDLSWPSNKIERHMSLSQSHQLTLVWSPNDGRQHADWHRFDLDIGVASACFQRASAANILLKHSFPNEILHIIELIKQPAPRLSTLHFDSHYENDWQDEDDGTYISNFLMGYPAMTELSLHGFEFYHSVNTPLVLLSRLHIGTIFTEYNLHSVLDTLRGTPNLTELVIDNIISDNYVDYPDLNSEGYLTLHHLRKLQLGAGYVPVHCFLMALSPFVPHLKEMHIHPKCDDARRDKFLVPHIFRKTLSIWSNTFTASLPLLLPLPPARLIWYPNQDKGSFLEVRTPINVSPTLGLRLFRFNEDMSFYKHHDMQIDGIEVQGLQSSKLAKPWSVTLDHMIDQLAQSLCLEHLTFQSCICGVPGLDAWIQRRVSEGGAIQRVMFIQCGLPLGAEGPGTWADYEELKQSGSVAQVEWVGEV